LFEIAFPP